MRKIKRYISRLRNQKAIKAKIASIDEDQKRLHKVALAEGYKDDVCPRCKVVFLAHKHFIDCIEARYNKCPMVKPGTKSLGDQALGK